MPHATSLRERALSTLIEIQHHARDPKSFTIAELAAVLLGRKGREDALREEVALLFREAFLKRNDDESYGLTRSGWDAGNDSLADDDDIEPSVGDDFVAPPTERDDEAERLRLPIID